jgi:hypothetical protein
MATVKHVVDDILRGYIEAALWSSTDESTPSGGDPLDKHYGPGDIAASSRKSMRRDIVKFVRANKGAVAEYGEHREYNPEHGSVWEHLGHDLWLTRNGHGAGFWDCDYGGRDEIGEKLTEGAEKLGSSDMFVGDDGQIYVSPER